MRTLVICTLLLLAPLSGCLGEDATVDAASADADPPLAPPVDAAASVDAAKAAAPGTLEERAIVVPIDLQGEIALSAAFCPLVACISANPLPSERFFQQDAKDGLVRYDLTLTWEASSPASETLRLGLAKGEGESRKLDYVEGTSPLVLSGDSFSVDGGKFDIWVWLGSATPGAETYATVGQPFTVSGTITIHQA